jgi:predicted glycoside hydrolase/deacetylase ChbG (UPF0249 family)
MARPLVVVADDFGIGPATSRGILDAAEAGVLSGTVLLVNSPHAADAVAAWERVGRPVPLGWHPCLTLDRPVLPPESVPSLVRPDGSFLPLSPFLRRALLGRIAAGEVLAEFRAQLRRFVELVGRPPTLINAHQHVAVFGPVGDALLETLRDVWPRPFLRRIREPVGSLARAGGARLKRAVLSALGRRHARRAAALGFPGCDWLAGVADPADLRGGGLWARRLRQIRAGSAELMCHPGRHDPTLVGRDADADDEWLARRVWEREWLTRPGMVAEWRALGFEPVPPDRLGDFAGRAVRAA